MKCSVYPRYKPSGVEWLGYVPEHWGVSRLGYLAQKVGSGKTPRGGAEIYQPEGVLLIRSQNVHDTVLRLSDAVFIDESVDEEMAGTRVLPGDVLLNITGASLGRCSVVPESFPRANVNQHVSIVRVWPKKAAPRFIQHVLSSQALQQQIFSFENGSSREGLNFQQVRSLQLALPDLFEQQAIADFLDRETAKIDTLVGKKRTLIERLKEKRTALISRTVTRGLPPAAARVAGLDPHPKLKPSGIDWLGDVPEHWETAPLYARYIVDLGKMLNEGRISGDYLVPYLRNIDVQWDRIDTSELPEMDIGPWERSRYTVKYGDLLVCEGGEVGRAAIVTGKADGLGYQKALHRLRPVNPDEIQRFLYYTLCWAAHQGVFIAGGNPNTIPHLTGETLRRYRFPKPPGREQRAIVDFLDRETAKIDQMIAKIEAVIDRLLEYRSALITAAVTGKIDVRTLCDGSHDGNNKA